MKENNENIYLIDGHALCYRAYYAIKDLRTSSGVATNAVYGFINILRKLRKTYDPDRLIVVFDVKGPTERHEKYEDYKATRKPMPDDLIGQIEKIKEVVEAFNIPILLLEGYEADDIIATVAKKAKNAGLDVMIVTSDKDVLQLVDDNIRVVNPQKAAGKILDAKAVEEKFGVKPKNMNDLMAMTGDAVDNIPGVKGIGQTTAGKLVNEFGSLKNIYDKIDKIGSETIKRKLLEGKESAQLSFDLVKLNTKVPIEFDLKAAKINEPDSEKLKNLFKELEFDKLLMEMLPRSEQKTDYITIKGKKATKEFVKKFSKNTQFAYCVDTFGDNFKNIAGISFCLDGEKVFYLSAKNNGEMFENVVREIFFREDLSKVGHDQKNDLHILQRYGCVLDKTSFDVMIADYLLNPSRTKYDLPSMVIRYLNQKLLSDADSVKWGKDGQSSMDLSVEKDIEAVSEKSLAIYRIYKIVKPLLKEKKLFKLFEEVEMPLVSVLQDMENEGVGIDLRFLKKQSVKLDGMVQEITKKIFKVAGEEFNLNSPKQLSVILYEKLRFPILKKTKTGASTDESVLIKLSEQHVLPKLLLEYREINKLKTTYYDSIIGLTDKEKLSLHAKFNQAVTATGRLSSSEPNIQNIPIKTEFGRKIRKAFIAKRLGYELIAVDYSQVELRVLAHLSGDKELVKAFKKGEDVHSFTASLIFDCDLKSVTDRKRSIAKTVNFGIVYGISPFGLSKDLDISIAEAQKFISAYFKRYKGVDAFIAKTIKECKKNGFVTTLLNRRRYIPEINSSNEQIRNFAERAAVNTVVQGSAADLIKLSMIKCYEKFNKTDISMTIQVHDELVFESPKKRVKQVSRNIREIMEKSMKLKVPLKVDIESGKNWFEMKSLEEE